MRNIWHSATDISFLHANERQICGFLRHPQSDEYQPLLLTHRNAHDIVPNGDPFLCVLFTVLRCNH